MGRNKRIQDEDLLAISRDVFIELGNAAPTREIARRAGVSEAVLFQRYGTKEALFFAAMAPQQPDIDAILERGTEPSDPCVALQEIALGILEYFRAVMPASLGLMTHPSFDITKFRDQQPALPELGLMARLTTFLAGERESGRIKTDDVNSIAGLLVAALHSLALFEVLGVHGGRMEPPAVRNMVRALWNGLGPISAEADLR